MEFQENTPERREFKVVAEDPEGEVTKYNSIFRFKSSF